MLSDLKTKYGIKKSVYSDYDFHDQPWYKTIDPREAIYDYLAHHCVAVKDYFYVYNRKNMKWQQMQRSNAFSALFQFYSGKTAWNNIQIHVGENDIKEFLSKYKVTFSCVTYIPGASPFVVFNDELRLNTYQDKRLTGDTDHIPDIEEWLKIIRNGLCAEPDEIDLVAMIDEINSDAPTKFRWVMHWLACRYQRPGYATGTNLWLLGTKGGIGKGTLVTVMAKILGGNAVGRAKQEDIKRGWDDTLMGHELLEWDEFKCPDGWHAFNSMIKKWTGNETIQVASRNKTPVEHPATAVHIFTCNDKRPVNVEEHDRRNTFIETVKGADQHLWAARTRGLFDLETREFKNPNLASCFAALLNSIDIDLKFINTTLETEKRLELKQLSQDTIKTWFEDDDIHDYWPSGEADNWSQVYYRYKEWFKDGGYHGKMPDVSVFKKTMEEYGFAYGKSTSRKNVATGKWKPYRYVLIFHPDINASDGVEEKRDSRLSIVR